MLSERPAWFTQQVQDQPELPGQTLSQRRGGKKRKGKEREEKEGGKGGRDGGEDRFAFLSREKKENQNFFLETNSIHDYQRLPANMGLAVSGIRSDLREGEETPLWTAGTSQRCGK